jgi:ArsR family metal-binding transcriptional regulator
LSLGAEINPLPLSKKTKMAYLDTITLTKIIPCLAEPGKIIVIGKPSHPLDDVIPYLATLPGVIAYNPNNDTLTFRRPRGFMTIYADKINITQVNDASEGLALLDALKDAINATWEHRTELTPATSILKAPGLLDIWKLLPCTNCGKCGEATCMAFAANLLQGKRQPDECSEMSTNPVFADRRSALLTIVAS